MKYSTEEALSEIMRRRNIVIVRRKQKQNRIISAASVALTALLILVIHYATETGRASPGSEGTVYGSFLMGFEAGGYILTALIAFVLGSIVTVLCIRNRNKECNNVENKNPGNKSL